MSLTSLREVVLEIAEEMVKEAEDFPKGVPFSTAGEGAVLASLKGYARQLRMACKAAGEEKPVQNMLEGFTNPLAQHAKEIDKHRAEFRKDKKEVVERSNIEESFEGEMVEVLGHYDSPFYHSIHPAMPIGALVPLDDAMYRLTMVDGHKKLLRDEGQTEFQKEAQKIKVATAEEWKSVSWDELKNMKTGN